MVDGRDSTSETVLVVSQKLLGAGLWYSGDDRATSMTECSARGIGEDVRGPLIARHALCIDGSESFIEDEMFNSAGKAGYSRAGLRG